MLIGRLGDRATDAIDRIFNGNNGLKNGLKSITFYVVVFLNILMLSYNENFKKWICRCLVISGLIIGIFTWVSFFDRYALIKVFNWRRAYFTNNNFFGYYISVVMMLTIMMFITEESKIFKIVSGISCLLYFPILVACDTFGAYLGILAGMIFVGIVAIFRFVKERSKKNIIELTSYCFALLCFLICTFSLFKLDCNGFTYKNVRFSYARVWLNVGNKKVLYSFNSVSQKEAEEKGLIGCTISDGKVMWGIQRTVLKYTDHAKIIRDFREVLKDFGALLGYAEGKTSTQDIDEDSMQYGMASEVSNAGSGRGRVWVKALDLIDQRPWFGWGIENTNNEFKKQYGLPEGNAHNIVLQTSAIIGIPGMLVLLGYYSLIVLKAIFNAKLRHYKKKETMFIIIGALITAILVNLIVGIYINKILIKVFVILLIYLILYAIVFIDKIQIRIADWNSYEFISCSVIVSYLTSSLFGNMMFCVVPIFITFVGILTYEVLNKKAYKVIDKES